MRYTKANKVVQCTHCQNDDFEKSKAQLNTSGMTFFNLDWLNRSAEILICNTCGKVEWFVEKNDSLSYDTDKSLDEITQCPACKGEIPSFQDKCPECNWTYKS